MRLSLPSQQTWICFRTGLKRRPGDLRENTTVEGWTVGTNEAGVVTDAALANSGNNFLALGSATITRLLPTSAGKNYIFRTAIAALGSFSWWSADGNANDIIGTNNGVFTNIAGRRGAHPPFYVAGEVGKGFHFDGTNTSAHR